MASYILKRLLLMVPTLLGVLLVTFIVTRLNSGLSREERKELTSTQLDA